MKLYGEKTISLVILILACLSLSACGAPQSSESKTASPADVAATTKDSTPEVEITDTEEVPESSDKPSNDVPADEQAIVETPEQEITAPEEAQQAIGNITLVATRSYNPNAWEDGVFQLPRSTTIKLPAEIAVTHGNGGGQKAYLFFGDMACRYDSSGKNKHTTYVFKKCTDALGKETALNANDFIATDGVITLHIQNGDKKETTAVSVTIETL